MDANGTLALAGRTNVNINGNVTSIVVTGYASPDDIAANTTISSNNVADMNVQYVGIGPINGAHQRALAAAMRFSTSSWRRSDAAWTPFRASACSWRLARLARRRGGQHHDRASW